MATVNEKMTALADEIRELSGTSGTMGLDAMANAVHTENVNFESNLSTQDNLIAQIQTALQGKAAGGGNGSGGGSIETITVKYNSLPEPDMMIHYIDRAMSLQSATVNRGSSFTVAKNTIFVIENCLDDSYDGCQKICGSGMFSVFLAIK